MLLVPAAGRARRRCGRGSRTALERRLRGAARAHPGRARGADPARGRRRRRSVRRRRSSAGDRLAMLVERIDELSLAHHDFGGRPNALLGGLRPPDRPAQGRAGQRRRVRALGRRRWPRMRREAALRARVRRRSTAPTSGCCAEAGARDDGDLIADASALRRASSRELRAARFDARAGRRRPGARPRPPRALALEVGRRGA